LISIRGVKKEIKDVKRKLAGLANLKKLDRKREMESILKLNLKYILGNCLDTLSEASI
jgi:hypothetical protein